MKFVQTVPYSLFGQEGGPWPCTLFKEYYNRLLCHPTLASKADCKKFMSAGIRNNHPRGSFSVLDAYIHT